MTKIPAVKLRIPRQDLQQVAAFHLSREAARDWAQGLPVANTPAVAASLIRTLGELNRVTLPAELRFDILEVLRPGVEVALAALSRRYLNQPLVMPDSARQFAQQSENLLAAAGTAYTIVAVETVQHREAVRETSPARLACEAIQRAMIFSGGRILQSYQLYQPPPANTWRSLHQLYLLAETQQLAGLPVPDPLSGGSSVGATYLMSLLVGCCKPNQMRQGELAALFHGLREWAPLATLTMRGDGDALFVVDLDGSQPPRYRSQQAEPDGGLLRFIDTSALVKHLEALCAKLGGDSLPLGKGASLHGETLVKLANALGSRSLRNFSRTPADRTVALCIGLSSVHFHVAGRRHFVQLLHGDNYSPEAVAELAGNPFLSPLANSDAWETANPGEEYLEREETDADHRVSLDDYTQAILLRDVDQDILWEQRYPVYDVCLADVSPGGYGLDWRGDPPPRTAER